MNINELLEQILKRLNPIAEKQNVELVLESFRPVSADVDEVKITLAFTNLIENAIKYNVEGGSVSVWVGSTLNGPKVQVNDTGIGIPKEHQERIFERFYRVDKSHSKERGGTGLGLSIVKHGALLHNAKVSVESDTGKGTRMEILFETSQSE